MLDHLEALAEGRPEERCETCRRPVPCMCPEWDDLFDLFDDETGDLEP